MISTSIPSVPCDDVRPTRVAVYTRTSRESEIDPSYRSSQAQQDACEAYIKSQPSLSCAPASLCYDDAGISGGTLERPALQRMLTDIAAGLIDSVVVYKLDRLSRSVTQFSQLMDIFDHHAVKLISVSQNLDSQHAAGRLAINALMTFAQFERENSSERLRDKVRATRRRGLWTGSVPPMGYDVRGQQLCVNDDEARIAVRIFKRFVALASITALVAELANQGVTTKSWVTQGGKRRGGLPIDKNYLYKLLHNRTLIGEMKSGAQWFPGSHDQIIPTELWDQAHTLLVNRRRPRTRAQRNLDDFLLAGLVFGTDGRAYSPWRSSVRNGRAYAYYIPQSKIAGGAANSDLPRCPAFELETVVVEYLRSRLRDPATLIGELPDAIKAHPHYTDEAARRALVDIDGIWDLLFHRARRDLLLEIIDRIIVGSTKVSISIDTAGVGRLVLDMIKAQPRAAPIPAAH